MEIINGKVTVPNDFRDLDDFEEWQDGTLNTLLAGIDVEDELINKFKKIKAEIDVIPESSSNIWYRNAFDALSKAVIISEERAEMLDKAYDDVDSIDAMSINYI